MKYFYLGLMMIVFLLSCNHNKNNDIHLDKIVVNFSELKKNPSNGFMMYNNKLFTGVAKSFLEGTKELKYLVTYSNGIKNGISKRWYDNGNINYETQYLNGVKQGVTKIWYRSGQLQSTATYFKGVLHGKQIVWYPTGEIQKERKLRYGQEFGMQKAWRKSGKLYANYEAVNGRIFGLLGSNMCYKVANEKVQK